MIYNILSLKHRVNLIIRIFFAIDKLDGLDLYVKNLRLYWPGKRR